MDLLLDAEKGSFLWSQRSYSERRFFRYPTIAPGTSTKLSPVHQVFHFIVLVNYGEYVPIPNSAFKIKGLLYSKAKTHSMSLSWIRVARKDPERPNPHFELLLFFWPNATWRPGGQRGLLGDTPRFKLLCHTSGTTAHLPWSRMS